MLKSMVDIWEPGNETQKLSFFDLIGCFHSEVVSCKEQPEKPIFMHGLHWGTLEFLLS